MSDAAIKDNKFLKISTSLQLTSPLSSKIAPNNSSKHTLQG